MKTTIVPAQITTVEDKIAGNMTFSQILLLVIPLITASVIYLIVSPMYHLTLPKLILMALQFLLFPPLAIRFKGKILANHLAIYLKYQKRPRIYVFTKNDIISRDIPEKEISETKEVKVMKQEKAKSNKTLNTKERIRVDQMLNNLDLSFRFQLNRKGGIDVSFNKNER
jgi:hypothetical protein